MEYLFIDRLQNYKSRNEKFDKKTIVFLPKDIEKIHILSKWYLSRVQVDDK